MIRVLNRSPRQALIMVVTVHYCTWNEIRSLGQWEQVQAPAPRQEVEQKVNEPGAATFAIRMQYGGEERTTELPVTQDMIGQLAFEAAFRKVSIGEFIGELIVAVVKQDLLQLMRVRDSFRGAGRVAASHSR